jgi:acetyl esterase/lipase
MATKTITQPLWNTIPDNLVDRFDPVYVEFYNKYNVGRPHSHQVPIEAYRANPSKYAIQYGRADGGEVFRVTEQKCPVKGGEISIRIFEPGPIEQDIPLRPAYVNFHGGGWVFGNLASDDPFCRRICREVNCVCFDVEYRVAPEFKHPTQVEDAWSALKWVSRRRVHYFN